MSSVHSTTGTSSGADSVCCSAPNKRLLVGVALGALTAVAAYYLILNGFNRYDMALTSFQQFSGGAMIYMGVAFSCVSVANLCYSVWNSCVENDQTYSEENMRLQIGGSILAPVVIVPAVLCCALGVVGRR